MKFDAITLRELRIPLVHFFETSFSRIYDRRVMLVTLHGTDCPDGWGECVAGEDPFYSAESVETAWEIISRYLAPMVLGKTIDSGRQLAILMERVRGNTMAKGAVENAVWDAEAVEKQQPLWKLLGGTRRDIACGVSIGIQDTVEQLLQKIATELAAGYQRIKVKVKPGWDIGVLRRIRERWPDILLSCDANSAYRLEDFAHLRQFDEFKLLMIEQPLWHDDIFFHARLQKEIQTAICLDESIHNVRDAQIAAELGACRIINIKVGRVGGFSSAIQIHNICKERGIRNWCGGMLESGIGRSHNIALSTLDNFCLPGDVSASKRYWKEDIIEPEVEVNSGGFISASDKPGRGYELRERLIDKLTIRKQTVRSSSASA